MVMTFEETKELEGIKQDNKKEIMRLEMANNREMHKMRMEALGLQLKVAIKQAMPIRVEK